MFKPLSSGTQDVLLLIARVLFAVIFIFSGVGKLYGFNSTAHLMQESGITFYPGVFIILAIIFELGGGFSILLGWCTRLGASALFIFTLLATFFIHHFWTYSQPVEQYQLIQFLKNLTILSGCIYIFCVGPGKLSVDGQRKENMTM